MLSDYNKIMGTKFINKNIHFWQIHFHIPKHPLSPLFDHLNKQQLNYLEFTGIF